VTKVQKNVIEETAINKEQIYPEAIREMCKVINSQAVTSDPAS